MYIKNQESRFANICCNHFQVSIVCRLAILLQVSLLATGCASGPGVISEVVDERPPIGSIDPIPRPDWGIGTVHEMIDVNDGEPSGYEVIAVLSDNVLRMKSVNGCIWEASRDWFSPSVRWENCGTNPEWRSGTQTVKRLEGELWPLAPGNTAAFRRMPLSSLGQQGTPEIRRCKVTGPFNIDVYVGNVDVLKVLCSTRRWDNAMEYRSWYWSVEHGPVKYVRARQNEGVLDDVELVPVKIGN